MNIYLVVEGFGEKRVYSKWIPYVNRNLRVASRITDVTKNHVFIVTGGGYPNYFDIIKDGALDVHASSTFDRLVIGVDSEDLGHDEKLEEISSFMTKIGLDIDYRIVVQHFCLETWALGNRAIVPRQPKTDKVREYRNIWDVLENDPAELPVLPKAQFTRAQFAELYLRAILNDRNRNITYTKRNTKALLNLKYYQQVKTRMQDTNHIASFRGFLAAFN